MTNTIIYKFCPNCKIRKQTSEFYPNKARHDNLASHCKKCMSERAKAKRKLKDLSFTQKDINRFFRKVIKTAKCWLWQGFCLPKGYGQFSINEVSILAHRFSFLAHNGRLNPTLDVLHRCDTPNCVNPEHLFEGTNQDNVDDMIAKGRNNKGEKVNFAKLTETEVIEIRKLKGLISRREAANRYNVTPLNIGMIWNNQTWKHLL